MVAAFQKVLAHLLRVHWIQRIVRKVWGLLAQEVLLPYRLEDVYKILRSSLSKGLFPQGPTGQVSLRAKVILSHHMPEAAGVECFQRQTILSSLAIYILS